jgi:ribosomal protein S1
VFIVVEDGITGLLPRNKVKDIPGFSMDNLKKGDVIELKVFEVKPDERRMTLTLPQDESEEASDWKNYAQTSTAKTSSGAFGGAFAAQLQAALKKK